MALVTKRHTSNAEEAFHDIGCRWNALQLLVLDTFFIETTALAEALGEGILLLLQAFASIGRRGCCKRLQGHFFSPRETVRVAPKNANAPRLKVWAVYNICTRSCSSKA
ncbi:hypothetical protein PI125_g12674 [Phytophthora idaei]|nr:hypothetical protein PI125_g12674 [Phytophthora idaei]